MISIAGWNDDVIKEFRENSGKVGGAYAGGDLILLSTTGAKSGKRHTTPLGPLYRGETMYVSSFVDGRYDVAIAHNPILARYVPAWRERRKDLRGLL